MNADAPLFPKFLMPAGWMPGMAGGDACTLSTWNAVLPDPREPSRLRRVLFTIEMRMQLMPDEVEVRQDGCR